MLKVTEKATELLVAAKQAEGGAPSAGIRIRKGAQRASLGNGTIAIGFAISDEPQPDDQEFEQNGLRIFVEDRLVEQLNDRILDVDGADDDVPRLVFR